VSTFDWASRLALAFDWALGSGLKSASGLAFGLESESPLGLALEWKWVSWLELPSALVSVSVLDSVFASVLEPEAKSGLEVLGLGAWGLESELVMLMLCQSLQRMRKTLTYCRWDPLPWL